MTDTRKNKAPLFYPLTHQEWIETVKNLTGAEIKVLYYVRSLDPFGDRNLEYSITKMASELQLSKGAVSKAVKKLDLMGLIDAELVQVKIRIRGSKSNTVELSTGNAVSYRKHQFPIGNHGLPEETQVSYRKQQFPIGNVQQLQPLPDMDSSPPHTIQTYSDFIDSLSEDERESFEKFVRVEWKKLKGEEIVSLERFLSKKEDFDNWHEKFLNSPAGRAAKKEAIAAQFDWRNDPRFEEWIWRAFNGGYLWTQEDEAEREQRYAFYEWAQNTNAYEGMCY